MKSYDLITPEGTRDLLFDECVARKEAEDKLRAVFTAHGYSEVITPALEFYDVFNNKTRSFRQEDMYKLTDGKGRLMVMRPDSTMPIARIVATRLRDGVFPLKLFCSQNIYRCNPKMAGRDDEFMQSGVEIIGGDEKRSDLEALNQAAGANPAFFVSLLVLQNLLSVFKLPNLLQDFLPFFFLMVGCNFFVHVRHLFSLEILID